MSFKLNDEVILSFPNNLAINKSGLKIRHQSRWEQSYNSDPLLRIINLNNRIYFDLNDLNDQCLYLILSYLSFETKVNVQRVCRRWKKFIDKLLKQQFSLSFQTLDTPRHGTRSEDSVTSNRVYYRHSAYVQIKSKPLKILLKKCSNLKAIKFNYCELNENFFKCLLLHLNKYVECIQFINCITDSLDGSKSWTKFCRKFGPQLKYVYWIGFIGWFSKDYFLENCKNIQILVLNDTPVISGATFTKIPSTIRRLSVLGCFLRPMDVTAILTDCNLENLTTLSWGPSDPQTFKKFCLKLTNLTALEFSFYSIDSTDDLEAISHLIKLKSLIIYFNVSEQIADQVDKALLLIMFNSKLVLFHVYAPKSVTDMSLKLIPNCYPSLRDLVISCTYATDSSLHSICQLKELQRLKMSSPQITNYGVYAVTESCEQLRDIDLSGCPSLTHLILPSIFHAANRIKDQSFHFKFNKNLVSSVQVVDKPSNLKISADDDEQ